MKDIERVVEKLAELGFVRPHKITGNYYTIYCPFHNSGNERRPSFGVSLKDEIRNGKKYPAGFAHCFTCGYAHSLNEFVSDILKLHNMYGSGLEWLTENIPGFTPDHAYELLVPNETISALQDKFAADYVRIRSNSMPAAFVPESELSKYRYTVPYMYERKLTDNVIAQYDVGFDPDFVPAGHKRAMPTITFPVHDKDGNTLFIYRRAIASKHFFMPSSIEKPVYGLDQIPPNCKSLCITESIINALTLVGWGYPAVALLGTGTPHQVAQLKSLGVNEFVLCLDGDDAGARGTQKLKNQLASTALIWVVNIPAGKDVNDLDKPTFDRLYLERN